MNFALTLISTYMISNLIVWSQFCFLQVISCIQTYNNTLEPLYSIHALQRTPLNSGLHFQEQIIHNYGHLLIQKTSLQQTPYYSGHEFIVPMVFVIARFHCRLNYFFNLVEIKYSFTTILSFQPNLEHSFENLTATSLLIVGSL